MKPHAVIPFCICVIFLSCLNFVKCNGGIYSCDYDPKTRSRNPPRTILSRKDLTFIHFDCRVMSLLTSSLNSYEVFESKLCHTMMYKSYILGRKNIMKFVWNGYITHTDIKVSYAKKEAYLLLLWAHQNLKPNQHGLWLEFGVYQGFSVNVTSFKKTKSEEPVCGFDSFKGLPTVWMHNNMSVYPKEQFSLNGTLPPVRHNVKLIPGWFNETLPLFLSQHTTQKVSYVNIDNDLYDGTVDILTQLLPKFEHQTLIHFHELFLLNDTTGVISGNSEMRALYDVMKVNPDWKLQFIPVQGMFKEPAVFRVIQH